MKPFFFIGAVLFSIMSWAGEKSKIVSLLQQQKTEWNKGNLVGYMQGYWNNDSLQFIGKKGITRGWKATLEQYQKSYSHPAAMGQLDFQELQVHLIDNNQALVIGRWQLTRETGNIGGYFTLWCKKINGEWKIIADHTS